MFKYLRFILPLIIFSLIIILLFRGLNLNPTRIPSPLINQSAPSFSLPNLFDLEKKISNKDINGKVVLVNVWATWCAACAEEHKFLMRLAQEESIFFLGLNYKDDPVLARQWLKQWGNPYRLVAIDTTGHAAIDWGVYGTPETFVLDKKGMVRYKQIGPIDLDSWERELKPLLVTLENESL